MQRPDENFRTRRAAHAGEEEAAAVTTVPATPPAVVISRWFAVATIGLAVLVPFQAVLLHDRSLAFRDTAVFYHPLFEWIEQQHAIGASPLWNPHLNYGLSTVGEGSSSLFYPGKVVFLLPLSFVWQFKIYVIGHVVFAAASGHWAARRHSLSREAATLVALAFSCGGSVLFQYCNVVYLVGAAWLPVAFHFAAAFRATPRWTDIIGLGVSLALMILGGDPQLAYHVLLATGALAVGTIFARSDPRSISTARRWLLLPRHSATFALVAAVGLMVALAAVQILPARETSRLSDRAAYHAPRNIYEAFEVVSTNPSGMALASEGFFKLPPRDTHAASIYEFSWGPWHAVEFVWPNISGSYFPQYRRWFDAIPAEPRMWSPSTYFGLLPVVLAIASLRLRRGSTMERWLSWCAVLAILASFGAFGIGWLIRQPLLASGRMDLVQQAPGDQVGGAYWFLVTFLPGYVYFRYPAKLLTFAAWPLTLLAGIGFDRLIGGDTRRPRRILIGIVALSGLLLVLVVIGTSPFSRLTMEIAPDAAYGPFDTAGGHREVCFALCHTLFVGVALVGLLRPGGWLSGLGRVRLLVAVTAVELVVANRPLVATAPSDSWRQPPIIASLLNEERSLQGGAIPWRVRPPLANDSPQPGDWAVTSSSERTEQLAWADRQGAASNHSLAVPLDWVDSLASQRLADHYYWFQRFHKNEESYWGNYWLMPRSVPLDGIDEWEPIASPALVDMAQMRLFRHREPFPRCWLVHDVVVLPPLVSLDPEHLSQRGADVVRANSPDGTKQRRDFRRQAVVEYAGPALAALAQLGKQQEPQNGPEEPCQIVVDEPTRVVIEITAPAPGLMVLADSYFPGWTAKIASDDETSPKAVEIFRTNRCYRGVMVPAGQSRVTFFYQPFAVYMGAAISGVAWSLLGVFFLIFSLHSYLLPSRVAPRRK